MLEELAEGEAPIIETPEKVAAPRSFTFDAAACQAFDISDDVECVED